MYPPLDLSREKRGMVSSKNQGVATKHDEQYQMLTET